MTRAIALVRNASDLVAVRVAVGLGDTTVITLAAESAEIEALLAETRALGATRCVRLWDEALASTDYLGVAIALAGTIRAVCGELTSPPTVIVCGDQGRGAVGPAVAERLGLPHLGAVIGAELVEGRVVARRREGELVRMYAAKPPLVIHVSALAAPAPEAARAAEAAGWTEAVATTEAWDLAKAGIAAHELAYRRRHRTELPSAGLAAPVVRPRVFPSAAALAARLRDDGLCGNEP
jgi:electron transfer flavoprotein alpha/beta subunit